MKEKSILTIAIDGRKPIQRIVRQSAWIEITSPSSGSSELWADPKNGLFVNDESKPTTK